jgi:hypothetical protein
MATMAAITDSSLDCTSFGPHSSAKQTIGHFAELVTKGSKPTSDAAQHLLNLGCGSRHGRPFADIHQY